MIEDEVMSECFAALEEYLWLQRWTLFRRLLDFREARFADDGNTPLFKFIWIWLRTIISVLMNIRRCFGYDFNTTDLAYITTGYSIDCGECYVVLQASTRWFVWGYEIYDDSAG